MSNETCPEYDNDECMADLGRTLVDIYLHKDHQGRQEELREHISSLFFMHVANVCEPEGVEPNGD